MIFGRAMRFVLDREGGLVNDVHDPGGLTKFGISQKAYPDIDIRTLTEAEAVTIYRRDYWDACRCEELPSNMAVILFDSAVNQGPRAAVRMLQAAVGVAQDGVIGPATIAAARNGSVGDFVARRALQYARHPNVERFGLGWFKRLAACHELAMELAAGERVS